MSSDDQTVPEMDGFIESAIENLPELFYVCDLEGNFIHWNDEFESVTGYDGEEIQSMHPTDFAADEESDRMEEAVQRIIEEGEGRFEETLRTKDGERIPVEATGAVLENGDEAGPYVYGTVRDITERKQREQQLSRQHDQIDQLTDRLLETSPTGVLVFDAAGDITLANDRSEEILGMESEELVGRSYTAFEFAGPNGASMPVEEMPVERVWQRGDAVFDMEVEATRPDGEHIWLSMNGAPLYEDTDDVSETIFTLEDITERKRREQRQEFLLELSDRIRDMESQEEIGRLCTRLLAEEMGLDRCYFVEFQPGDDQALVGPEHHGSGLEPVAGPYPYSAFPEAIKQIETETPVYDDVASDETLPEAEREALLELDFGAWVGVPVRTEEKDVDRALYAVTTEPHQWTADEVSLVEETADRAWTAMERAQAEEELARKKNALPPQRTPPR